MNDGARPFVRDTSVLGGRWAIEGTAVSVAQVRYDLERMSRDDVLRSYQFINLTDAEIDQIMVFPFDPIRDLTLQTTYASVTVGCVCGEDTPMVITQTKDVAHCICGRDWKLQASVSISLLQREVGMVSEAPTG